MIGRTFLNTKEFFSIARLCSAKGTKHSFHLMNWMDAVFGSNLVDYVPFEENYGRRDFSLKGRFKDSSRALKKLEKDLRNEMVSRP